MARNKGEEKQGIAKQESKTPARAISPFEEMDRLFAGLLGHTWPRSWMQPFQWERPLGTELGAPFGGHWPKVDVVDRENDILVRAELPGVKKEDMDISMTDNTVTVRGCTSEQKEEKKDNYYRSEISRGEFSRTIALPCEVDSDKASAKLESGVLELTLPKQAKSRRKNIKVS